jgi:lipoyl(octanoyl) transferase
MARDEALLELVAADPAAAAFRTYGWTEPTLSLGYFQSIAEVEASPRWRSLPVVRRPTGGGALLHDQEVTYAIVLPRRHALYRQAGAMYAVVHAAILDLLAEQGIAARRRGDSEPREGRPRPFLCFADRDPEDVVSGPTKLVGSAQRRRSGAVLQHGSVLLRASPITPELSGAAELGMPIDDPADWAAQFEQQILEALGLVPMSTSWDEPLLQRADEIERSVYRADSWTRRR